MTGDSDGCQLNLVWCFYKWFSFETKFIGKKKIYFPNGNKYLINGP